MKGKKRAHQTKFKWIAAGSNFDRNMYYYSAASLEFIAYANTLIQTQQHSLSGWYDFDVVAWSRHRIYEKKWTWREMRRRMHCFRGECIWFGVHFSLDALHCFCAYQKFAPTVYISSNVNVNNNWHVICAFLLIEKLWIYTRIMFDFF